ncbi:CU044_2847 family protein [Thiothrix nivea]|uniref:Trypsin-co-occurring domain-containing protein n=1 Tax=Thiothrix nivea (strain ATCC 35100 / DSM 5205 / JP2) TaxID=870187 RepID=A0A656HG69_THINJ|nr:CU044_2847 family protein [Thiothrix nivea]EIJ35437.1 hypothetical protein Thini_2906 [Thiothrix nivea DSM 5205]
MNNKRVIGFELSDGELVYIEIEDTNNHSELVSNSQNDFSKIQIEFSKSLGKIKSLIDETLTSLQDINNPDEVNLEFGIKLDGKVGALIASSGIEANFKVLLKWKGDKN